jgi:hypothetical protein
MSKTRYTGRRTVLKTLGAGIVGGVAMVSPVNAHDPKNNGQILVLPTWGDHEIWELIDAEPPSRDRLQDAEGNDHAHVPIYLIKAIPGSSHSPMFPPADQVIPVPGGPAKEYSAQWHPKVVVDPELPILPPGHPDNPFDFPFPNLVNEDQDGNPLTSATAIQGAENVLILAESKETVFTCPARPHHDRGPKD